MSGGTLTFNSDFNLGVGGNATFIMHGGVVNQTAGGFYFASGNGATVYWIQDGGLFTSNTGNSIGDFGGLPAGDTFEMDLSGGTFQPNDYHWGYKMLAAVAEPPLGTSAAAPARKPLMNLQTSPATYGGGGQGILLNALGGASPVVNLLPNGTLSVPWFIVNWPVPGNLNFNGGTLSPNYVSDP